MLGEVRGCECLRGLRGDMYVGPRSDLIIVDLAYKEDQHLPSRTSFGLVAHCQSLLDRIMANTSIRRHIWKKKSDEDSCMSAGYSATNFWQRGKVRIRLHLAIFLVQIELALRVVRDNFQKKFVWERRESSRVFTFGTWSIFEYFVVL